MNKESPSLIAFLRRRLAPTRRPVGYCLAQSRRYAGGRYSCTEIKQHDGLHHCGAATWDDEGGSVRVVSEKRL